MVRLKGKDLWNLIESTREGCDKQCDKCDLFLLTNNECFHQAQKKWKEWNDNVRTKTLTPGDEIYDYEN